MNVKGHGVDIVDISGVKSLLDRADEHFLGCFTETERRDAGAGPNRAARLAGRFAAKEAVLKALGTGWGNGIAWTDVEIETLGSGAPAVELHGRASEIAKQLGISSWLLSTSHSEDMAVASVLALTNSK